MKEVRGEAPSGSDGVAGPTHGASSGAPLSLVRPARSGNAFEETMSSLLHAIKLGVFPPGSRLPAERELAEHLGVSRSTLREALAELQNSKYVSIQRGRYGGAVVLPVPTGALGSGSVDLVPEGGAPSGVRGASAGFGGQGDLSPDALSSVELEDVLRFRGVLEPGAAALAAGSELSADDRRRLVESFTLVAESEPDAYRPLDSRFHLVIAELSGSSMLAQSVALARTKVNELLAHIPLLSMNLEHANDQHQAIVNAILAGDAGRARVAMQEHLDGTAALLRGFLAEGR